MAKKKPRKDAGQAGQVKVIDINYAPNGAVRRLWTDLVEPECVLTGPASTGKSRGAGEFIHFMCTTYPGIRVLVCRKTRTSLTESFMVTFEEKVLPPNHESLRGAARMHRHSYDYNNGSTVVLGGMDQKTRLFSTEYDIVYIQECTEVTEDEWESLHRAMRNRKIPHPYRAGEYYTLLFGDCNPDAPTHWLRQRMNAGRAVELATFHQDNPSNTPDYMQRLSTLTGVRRQRLFLGLWVAAEGQIYECWNPGKHIIDADLRKIDSQWFLEWSESSATPGKIKHINWFVAGMDWGYRAPGSLGVFAVDDDNVMYLVREWYHTKWNQNQWADVAERARAEFDIKRFICDNAEPDGIDIFNRRMGQVGGHWIATPCDKTKDFKVQASIVRERLENNGLFVLRNCRQVRDPELVENKKPIGLIEEMPEYVYAELKDGKPVKEEPDRGCADHSQDMLRYVCAFVEHSDWREGAPKPKGRGPRGGDLMFTQRVRCHDRINEFIGEPDDKEADRWWKEEPQGISA